MTASLPTTVNNAQFIVTIERIYGVQVTLSRSFLDGMMPGWWDKMPLAGAADYKNERIWFAVAHPDDHTESFLNYALAHELGHILEARDQGIELYRWRSAVELFEIETEAWDCAHMILAELEMPGPGDAEWAFRHMCLDSYLDRVQSPEYQREVDHLLAQGHLDDE